MSFAVVDQELWLLFKYRPIAVQRSMTQVTPLRCYEFNKNVNSTKVHVNTNKGVFFK